ncbi:MAG: TonB-dependent receptor [Balneolia bacterium]|nr:TonB-dependent receptor [Balneolia bacterium]
MQFLYLRAALFSVCPAISYFFLLLAPGHLYASESDTLKVDLGEVYIEASRLAVPWRNQPVQVSIVGSERVEATASSSLGDALRFNSPVMVRTYGLGGIQSVSGRGFGARQTQLMWNGFSINHPMLGEVDYNLVPSSMTSDIRVVSGNSSAGFGDGGAAGTILFDSARPKNETAVKWSTGAWGQQQLQLSSGYHGSVYRAGIVIDGRQATNNYPYFDDIRGREETRRNNQLLSRQAMVTAGFTGGNWNYDTSVWLAGMSHHISGSSTVRNPSAVQDDDFLRWSNHLSYVYGSTLWQLSSFYEDYTLNYTDAPSRIESLSDINRQMYRLMVRYAAMNGLFLSGGFDGGFTRVESNDFAGSEQRRQLSAYVHAEYRPGWGLSFYPSARLVSYSDFGERVTGSLGMNWQTPLNWLSLRGQLASNFSPPGLNDLFWAQGGNPELKPEISRSAEAGIAAAFSRSGLAANAGLTVYTIEFENGIRWIPGSGGLWSPVNLYEISSRGVEMDGMLNYTYARWTLQSNLAVAYTRAESPRTEQQNGQTVTVNRQLTYVPKWSWKAGGGLRYGAVFSNISWQRTGSRFSTADHSAPIDPLSAFTDITLQLGTDISFRASQLRVSYTVHNLTDETYEFIARYPMPPRYHTLSVRIGFSY